MRWSRVPALPAHLVHHTADATVTVLAWLLLAFIITGVGGWTASRATTGRRVSAAMTVTLAGVMLFAAGIWYHRSLPN